MLLTAAHSLTAPVVYLTGPSEQAVVPTAKAPSENPNW